jgi:hypothetical protein
VILSCQSSGQLIKFSLLNQRTWDDLPASQRCQLRVVMTRVLLRTMSNLVPC